MRTFDLAACNRALNYPEKLFWLQVLYSPATATTKNKKQLKVKVVCSLNLLLGLRPSHLKRTLLMFQCCWYYQVVALLLFVCFIFPTSFCLADFKNRSKIFSAVDRDVTTFRFPRIPVRMTSSPKWLSSFIFTYFSVYGVSPFKYSFNLGIPLI